MQRWYRGPGINLTDDLGDRFTASCTAPQTRFEQQIFLTTKVFIHRSLADFSLQRDVADSRVGETNRRKMISGSSDDRVTLWLRSCDHRFQVRRTTPVVQGMIY